MFTMNKTFQIIFVIVVSFFFSGAARAEKMPVFTIGITEYDSEELSKIAGSINTVSNDLSSIQMVFRAVGDIDLQNLESKDNTLENVRKMLCQDFDSEVERQAAVVYFTGCAFAQDGEMYLALKDSRYSHTQDEGKLTDEALATMLPVSEICRAFSESSSEKVILLLDLYFEKGTYEPCHVLKDMEKYSDVIILANSRTFEPNGKGWHGITKQSLAYWVQEALKGFADLDRNYMVTLQEIVEYAEERLQYCEACPNPLNIQENDLEIEGFCFNVKAFPIEDIVDDMAVHLMMYADQKIQRFHTSGFQIDDDLSEEIVSAFSEGIVDDDYIDTHKISRILTERLIQAVQNNLEISRDADGDEDVELECSIREGEKFYFLSMNMKPKDKMGAGEISDESILWKHRMATGEIHGKVLIPETYNPSQVCIKAKRGSWYFSCPLEQIDGQYYTVLEPGDIYQIIVKKQKQDHPDGPEMLGVRIFVDGRSILAQSYDHSDKIQACCAKFDIVGADSESEKSSDRDISGTSKGNGSGSSMALGELIEPEVAESFNSKIEGPSVSQAKARFFRLGSENKDVTFQFNGFYNENHEVRAFQVQEVDESDKLDKRFGIITLTFYQLCHKSTTRSSGGSGVRTIEGALIERGRTKQVSGIDIIEKPLQEITLHYVTSSQLKSLKKNKNTKSVHWAE